MIDYFRLESDSPNMRKVSLMLAETGLPFTEHFVDKASHGAASEDYLKISPSGAAPAIVDRETGASVFETGAILCYLAEKAEVLLPKEPEARSSVLKWLMFEVANIGPTMIELRYHLLEDDAEGAEARLRRYQERIGRSCSILDEQLRDRPFLAGDYSIADIALYPWSPILEDMADVSLADFPNLQAWMARIGSRPTVARLR